MFSSLSKCSINFGIVFFASKQSVLSNNTVSAVESSKPALTFFTNPKFCLLVCIITLSPYFSFKFSKQFKVAVLELSFINITLFIYSSGVFLNNAYTHIFTHSGELYIGIIISHFFILYFSFIIL
ncbi:hypothetical protein D3C73_1078140 [compost metagenome]